MYVYYTATTPSVHNRISRFRANGDVADTTEGEVVILDFDNLSSATNHNGGAMHFGVDGMLYAAHGENANSSNSQSMTNLLGKIIRMNPVPDSTAQIPTDNPFFTTATGKNRLIWARGLRNPFTFSIQPGTGLTYINDVGETTWEEINDARAGRNFGWPTTEGTFNSSSFPHVHQPRIQLRTQQRISNGLRHYGRNVLQPFESDISRFLCRQVFLRRLLFGLDLLHQPGQPRHGDAICQQHSGPSRSQGRPRWCAVHLARDAASVYRITSTGSSVPQITQQPADRTVPIGGTATFTVAATGTAPLSYQWQKNSTNIAGATTASYTTPPVGAGDNNSAYRCVVTNAAGTVTSNAGILTITSNTAPSLTILTPTAGSRYSGGTTLSFSGTGTDAQDGTLPASAFTWRIDFHHDTHTHPAMLDRVGILSGTFAIPSSGETSANVWYRLHLTVRDSGGLSTTGFRDIAPNTAVITLATSPAGLRVTLDGQPVLTPLSVTSVVGIVRALGVVSPQTSGRTAYSFVSWSESWSRDTLGGDAEDNRTYTATYASPPSAPTGLR